MVLGDFRVFDKICNKGVLAITAIDVFTVLHFMTTMEPAIQIYDDDIGILVHKNSLF